jgi:hypothetical protein
MTRQRLDLREAAEHLGTTVDAVRKRVQRGSLDSEKGEDGRVYVWLDVDKTKAELQGSALVEELRDRVRFLERLLEEEREARTEERRRHDTLMAQLMSRIPELENPAPSPSEPPGERETATEQPERVESRIPADSPPDEREYAVTPMPQPGRVEPQTPLEGAQEPQESPGLAEDEQQGRGPVPDAGESQEPSERPWWRRIFEG